MTSRGASRCAVLALVLVASFSVPAAAWAGDGERITSYAVDVAIRSDGVVHIREIIVYDFGTGRGHGIHRDIPLRARLDARHDRVYEISGITVTSPDGAPAQAKTATSGGNTVIRVGDPGRTVTGQHTYVLGYDIRRALTRTGDQAEFYWDLVGDGWAVPISDASVHVSGPAKLTWARCYAGASGGGSSCDSGTVSGQIADFRQASLWPHQGLTARVRLPANEVSVLPPLTVTRQDSSPLAALRPAPLTGGLAAAIVILVPAVLWLPIRRRRRPAAPVAGPTGPPEGVRPGQAGTILAGRALCGHVAATIIDLAVRGHLRIEEKPAAGGMPDWRLTRSEPDRTDMELLPYESTLLHELFGRQSRVPVSSLVSTLPVTMRLVCAELGGDAVRRGWLRRRRRTGPGFLLIALAAVAFVTSLALPGTFPPGSALVAAALAFAGALIALAGRLDRRRSRRTPDGERVLDRLQSFRRDLRHLPTDTQLPPEHVPYALVFGMAAWTERFQRPAAAGPAATTSDPAANWYTGDHGYLRGARRLTGAICALVPQSTAKGFASWDHLPQSARVGTGCSSGDGMSAGSVGSGDGGGGGGSW